ncbi:MAG TPA: CARDB domain-containing protein, partial [Vicinamibacterales bacterium]|nr:CARDB domain-containing protein [Vicinamibacterales bacterium]
MASRMRFGLICVAVALGLMGQVGARQQRPEGGPPARPNFDIRSSRAPAAASGRALAELARRRAAQESSVARLHPQTGAIRVLDAPGVASTPGAATTELQNVLRQAADRLGLDDEDLEAIVPVRDYVSTSTGLRHVTFAQTIDGLPVFGALVSLHIAADGTIVRITSSAARGAGRERNAVVPAEAAAVAAATDVGQAFTPARLDPGTTSTARFARGRFLRDVTAALEWFAIDGGVRLAWHVELEVVAQSQFYDFLIDATSGELLLRRNRVLDAEGTGRVIQSAATQAIDQRQPDEMPTGDGGCPPVLNHELRDLTAPFRDSSTVLSNTGRLSGNNVHVFRGDPDTEAALGTFDGTRWIFDAPFGSAASAESALFFALNFAHDFFYDLGFDEAAGNFQANNFGRGGVGGDAIAGVARAAGRNNATFQPEPEGTSPIISMFLWDGAGCWSQDVDGDGTVDLDGDYDSDIILHEFHHGVNHRLNTQFTGDEAGAIGEGGGDFFAYSINGNTTLAEYASPGGIRSINAKTYADWLCLFGFFCEVHLNGEIWANVLWDVRERFRTDLVGGSEGVAINEVYQLYIDGLKLSPPAPTMLDIRDAMLLADTVRNPGSPHSQNYCALWEPFAGRGMGVNATDTSENPNNQVTASFSVPSGCNPPPAAQIVSIAATTATANEAGPVNGAFTVSRSEPGSTALVVNLSVSGTAIAGTDYVTVPLTATIPPDASSVVVPVTPIDDAIVESSETVILRVIAGAGYTLGSPSAATVNIVSDDLAPDFSISAFTVPETAAAGQTITVTDTTRNQGSGAGSASTTWFYLSTNGSIDGSDTFLGTRDVPALAPSASNSGSTDLTIPALQAPGTYYIIAKADGPGLLQESLESNNTRTDTVKVGPDLVVSAFSAPTYGGAGLQIAVTSTTKNQGAGVSAASTTRFYLSVNYTLDGSDEMLGAFEVQQLGAGELISATTTLTIPTDSGTGTYYLLAVADADGEVAETSDTNNTRTDTIRIGADLQVSVLTVPARAAVGGTISVGDTTKNAGAGDSDASRTAFYLSVNASYDAGDIPLGAWRSIPPLAAGAQNSGTTQMTLPANAGPGRWYLIARADDLGQVAETQETNNTKYGLLDIGPDLGVYSATAPTSVIAGTSLTVSDTIKNSGIDMASPSANRYYLSLNTTLDGSDILLDGQRAVPALAYNATNSGSAVVQIPAGMSGPYYLLIVADGNGVVAESSETNNVRARSL